MPKMMKVMLNTNVYCRPLDDLTDKDVELEAKSAKELFDFAHSGMVVVITSEILFYEINFIEVCIVFHISLNLVCKLFNI